MSQIAQGIKQGDWYAHCQVCGRRFFGSTLHVRWDNLFVCDDDYEERNPADTPVIIVDTRNPPRVSKQLYTNNSVAYGETTATNTEYWYANIDP